jgi:hypothetical protein
LISLLGGHAQHLKGSLVVLPNAAARDIGNTESSLGVGVPLLGGLLI